MSECRLETVVLGLDEGGSSTLKRALPAVARMLLT